MLAVHSCCLSLHLQGNDLHKDLLLNFSKKQGKSDYLQLPGSSLSLVLKNTFFSYCRPKEAVLPKDIPSPWRHLGRGITYHVNNQVCPLQPKNILFPWGNRDFMGHSSSMSPDTSGSSINHESFLFLIQASLAARKHMLRCRHRLSFGVVYGSLNTSGTFAQDKDLVH